MGECGLFLNVQERKISEICLSHKTASFRTQFSSMEKVTQVNCTLSICLCSQISNHFNFLSFPKDLPAKKRDSKMANWFNSSLALDSLKIFQNKKCIQVQTQLEHSHTCQMQFSLYYGPFLFPTLILSSYHQQTQLHICMWS